MGNIAKYLTSISYMKHVLISSALLFLFGCTNNESHITRNETSQDTLVVWQVNSLKTGLWSIDYFKLTKNKKENITSFIYSSDSAYYAKDSIMTRFIPKSQDSLNYRQHTRTVSINQLHDTLLIRDNDEREIGGITETVKYILSDSLLIKLGEKNHKLYCYRNLEVNPQWDETLYFSREFGMLYAKYESFQMQQELKQNSVIKNRELEELMLQIKAHDSGTRQKE